jgi:hypothetical protein
MHVCMQVVPAAGVTKDAAWIANLHKEVMLEVTAGDHYRLLGFVMDNTRANRAAMVLLRNEFKHLINIGCQAHGLSLLIKDMAKDKSSIVSKTLDRANILVNAINDSEKLRALVQEKQRAEYNKVRNCV